VLKPLRESAEGKSLTSNSHDDGTAIWHILAIDDLESGEESPHTPVGELSNDPVGDVGFSHG
jgi:hypothetical protein